MDEELTLPCMDGWLSVRPDGSLFLSGQTWDKLAFVILHLEDQGYTVHEVYLDDVYCATLVKQQL